MALADLNASSGKILTFKVRIVHPELETYTYVRDGQKKTGQNFKCYIVGERPCDYVIAVARAPKAHEAHAKYTDGSCWKMSKVSFDAKMVAGYISGPIKCCINVGATTFQSLPGAEASGLPTYLLPKYTVADATEIKLDGIHFDVFGKVQHLSETRVKLSIFCFSLGPQLVTLATMNGNFQH